MGLNNRWHLAFISSVSENNTRPAAPDSDGTCTVNLSEETPWSAKAYDKTRSHHTTNYYGWNFEYLHNSRCDNNKKGHN